MAKKKTGPILEEEIEQAQEEAAQELALENKKKRQAEAARKGWATRRKKRMRK